MKASPSDADQAPSAVLAEILTTQQHYLLGIAPCAARAVGNDRAPIAVGATGPVVVSRVRQKPGADERSRLASRRPRRGVDAPLGRGPHPVHGVQARAAAGRATWSRRCVAPRSTLSRLPEDNHQGQYEKRDDRRKRNGERRAVTMGVVEATARTDREASRGRHVSPSRLSLVSPSVRARSDHPAKL